MPLLVPILVLLWGSRHRPPCDQSASIDAVIGAATDAWCRYGVVIGDPRATGVRRLIPLSVSLLVPLRVPLRGSRHRPPRDQSDTTESEGDD